MTALALLLAASFAIPHLGSSPWYDFAGVALQLWLVPIGLLALCQRRH